MLRATVFAATSASLVGTALSDFRSHTWASSLHSRTTTVSMQQTQQQQQQPAPLAVRGEDKCEQQNAKKDFKKKIICDPFDSENPTAPGEEFTRNLWSCPTQVSELLWEPRRQHATSEKLGRFLLSISFPSTFILADLCYVLCTVTWGQCQFKRLALTPRSKYPKRLADLTRTSP